MIRNKSTLEDELILNDETANPADRASAAESLASDGFGKKLHPILDKWLNHSEFILRNEAIWLLLGAWGHQKYFNKAIDMLKNDSHWIVRKGVASYLVSFTQDFIEGEKYERQIMKELILSLLNDEDEFVQRNCYKNLHQLIRKEKLKEDKNHFDCEKDVDWEMLEPYLKKYDLQKPN